MPKALCPQVWVLELSSFQLEGVTGFEPTAATVLNVTQDHLDWHGSMEAYAAAKARVFGQTGVMVLNREDPLVMKMLPEPVRIKGGKYEQRPYVTFGGDLPPRPGDFGLDVVNDMAWLVRAHEAAETEKRRKGEEPEIHLQLPQGQPNCRCASAAATTPSMRCRHWRLALCRAIGLPSSRPC